ncbi:MAG TPA: hypothetical protein VN174_02325 [Candidatus Methanoperedens sp.]|nr:hypothetical protein [Candidatus Methanoperedens sp.]
MGKDVGEVSKPEISHSKVAVTEKKILIPKTVEAKIIPDNVDEQLEELREDIGEEIDEERAKTLSTQAGAIAIKKAEKKLAEFDDSKNHYSAFKEEKGIIIEEKKVSRIQAWAGKLGKNINRLSSDIRRKNEIRRQIKSGEMNLEEVDLRVEVMDRNALIEDPRMQELWEVEGNSGTLLNFAEKELYQEVNATHWIMLTGASVEEVQAIVEKMGHNPDAFFSDDRGENGGRLAIDNYQEDMPIDETDSRYEEEKKYWEPLFKNKLLPESIKKWHMSRNHAVVYAVKNSKGESVLMLPIHIDPKNWVVSIKEIFNPPKKGERSALAYHNIAEGEKRYLGTGLYEAGIYQFIHLLKSKQPGLFGSLEVIGEEKLDTTRTISGDDQEAMVLERVFKDKAKV